MTDVEYKEYTSEDGEFILRTLKHDCKRESCKTCKEGAVSYMISHKDQDLWVNMATMPEEEDTEELRNKCLNGHLKSRDDYYRLSFVIGYGWDSVVKDEDKVLQDQLKALTLIQMHKTRLMVIKEATIDYLKEHRRLTDMVIKMEREMRVEEEESLLDVLTDIFAAAADDLREDRLNWQSAG